MKVTSVITPAIKGIFFDAGDTLFEAKESIGTTYSRFAARHGVQQDAAFLNRRFKTVFDNSPPLAFPGIAAQERKQREFTWWHQVAREIFKGIHFERFDFFFEDLYHFYEQDRAWRLFPETKAVLSDLKAQGYFIGMISNFDSRLSAICKVLGIRSFFDDIRFSSREGFAKPSPEIFEIALKHAGLAPAETIHVGDSIKYDIAGAEKVGMMPILIDRKSAVSADYPGRRIVTLSEICHDQKNRLQ